jgi:hypothetical protein
MQGSSESEKKKTIEAESQEGGSCYLVYTLHLEKSPH